MEHVNSLEFIKLLKEVKQLTHNNDHGRARLEIAKFFKLDNTILIYTQIIKIHEVMGHMQHDLSRFRDSIDREMFSILERRFDYHLINKIRQSL